MQFSSRILVTSVAFLLVAGCGGGSNNNAPATAAQPANVKDVAANLKGACTALALPEITQADGKEVGLADIAPGEYDYVSGEMFVFSQGTDKSKVEALVIDKADDSGKIQANLSCNHVDAQDVLVPTTVPTKQMASTDPVAQEIAASASPSPAPLIVNAPTAELDAFLKMVFNPDHSLTTTGLRKIVVVRTAGQAQVAMNQTSDDKATTNLTKEQLKGFSPANQIETHYFLTTDGKLTILARQGVTKNGVSSYDFMKIILAKPAPAAIPPVAANNTAQ